jgi:hypothetical protein
MLASVVPSAYARHARHDTTPDATDDAEHDGTWAILAEAASLLGCSVDTVRRRIRRRIRRRELHAVQDAGRHGPTWRVLLTVTPSILPTPSSTPSVNGATPSTTPSTGEEGAALLEALRTLDAMRQENRDLAGQVGYLQARVQMHEATIRTLQAPAVSPAPVEAPGAPEEPAPTTNAPVPWYRRWRSWLAAGLVVAVVGSASCQASASMKHPGLCTSARATMDFWANVIGTQPPPDPVWPAIQSAINVAEKAC